MVFCCNRGEIHYAQQISRDMFGVRGARLKPGNLLLIFSLLAYSVMVAGFCSVFSAKAMAQCSPSQNNANFSEDSVEKLRLLGKLNEILAHLGVPKPGFCNSYAEMLFCALGTFWRSFESFVCPHLCSFASFCVRPRLERLHLGTSEEEKLQEIRKEEANEFGWRR